MKAPTFDILTLGCVKNEADSDAMRDALCNSGFFQEPKNPDLLLINTCSFLQVATEQSIDAILSASERYGQHWNGAIIVCGCLPSRYPKDLASELPEVAAFVPCDKENDIARIASEVVGWSPSNTQSLRIKSSNPTFAFVKISDGCNRKCAFCAIPNIRGPLHSRTLSSISDEMRALAQNGVKEIVLVAQDTAAYGRDFLKCKTGPKTFLELLQKLDDLALELSVSLRVLYIQPDELNQELIDFFAAAKTIYPYFDIPLQHTHKGILKSMGRLTTFDAFLDKVSYIKRRIPEASIRTTALVGYPGETDDIFHAFVEDIKRAPIDYLAVFKYSQEDGTRAAQLVEQVDDATKQQRYQSMYDVSQELGFTSVQNKVGQTWPVLIDGYDEEESTWYGHAPFQAPDTDGVVYVRDSGANIGDIVQVLFDEAVCYDIFGHAVG